MSSTSEEGYTLNKSGHFASLGKVYNNEIFKESDLNLRISTLNEKERGRRIREAIKQKQLEEKKRDSVIGSGSNNWIFATDEYGKYLVPEVVKAGGKKPKFAVSYNQDRYEDDNLIVYSILTLLEKQPQLYGRGIQTLVPNQIKDGYQIDVLSYVKSKRPQEYDIDDNLFGDLVVSNLILPREDNKLANYLTQNETLPNGKVKITEIARCDLDALNFFVNRNGRVTKNLVVFCDKDWLYTWPAMGLSKLQLRAIKKKLIDKINSITPEDIVLAVQKQFSICGVKYDEQIVRKALFYYKNLLLNLREFYTGKYTQFNYRCHNYLSHTRLNHMTDDDIKKAIVEEAIKENKKIAKLSQKLQTFDNIKDMSIQAHDQTTYNDMFKHFKKVRDAHKAVIGDDVKQAITKKLEEFKCFNFEETTKESKLYFKKRLLEKQNKENKNEQLSMSNKSIKDNLKKRIQNKDGVSTVVEKENTISVNSRKEGVDAGKNRLQNKKRVIKIDIINWSQEEPKDPSIDEAKERKNIKNAETKKGLDSSKGKKGSSKRKGSDDDCICNGDKCIIV